MKNSVGHNNSIQNEMLYFQILFILIKFSIDCWLILAFISASEAIVQ